MKAALFTALLLWSSALCGQSYIPFVDTSATWQDEDAWWDIGPDVGSYRCYRYYFAGDTLLNDTLFKVLLSDGHGGFTGPLGVSLSYHSGVTVGFMHEDTTARRVYFREPGWAYSRLFYDFSVGVGPYPFTCRYWSNSMTVASVDTLVLADGAHRRLILNTGDHVVEGIGSLTAVIDDGYGIGVNWLNQLSCHTANGSPNYEMFSDDCACGTNVGVADERETQLRVGPSPTDGICRLESAPANAQVQLLSLDGRSQFNGQCSLDGSLTLDLSPLSPGIYVVVVTDGTTMRTSRVVRQ